MRNCIYYCERENKLRRYLLNISFLTSYTPTPFVFMKTSTTFSVFVFRNKLRRKKHLLLSSMELEINLEEEVNLGANPNLENLTNFKKFSNF